MFEALVIRIVRESEQRNIGDVQWLLLFFAAIIAGIILCMLAVAINPVLALVGLILFFFPIGLSRDLQYERVLWKTVKTWGGDEPDDVERELYYAVIKESNNLWILQSRLRRAQESGTPGDEEKIEREIKACKERVDYLNRQYTAYLELKYKKSRRDIHKEEVEKTPQWLVRILGKPSIIKEAGDADIFPLGTLGTYLYERGRYQLALEAYNKALTLDPQNQIILAKRNALLARKTVGTTAGASTGHPAPYREPEKVSSSHTSAHTKIWLPDGVSLDRDEIPLWSGHRAIGGLWFFIGIAGICLLIAIFSGNFLGNLYLLLFSIALFAWIYIVVRKNEIFVSDKRIWYKKFPLIPLKLETKNIRLDSVSDITLMQEGLIDKILNFGILNITTPVEVVRSHRFDSVPDPVKILGLIQPYITHCPSNQGNTGDISHKNVKELQTLAFQLYEQQKYQESLNVLDQALVIDPGNPDSWDLKGGVLENLNRLQEAIEAFDKVLLIKPNDIVVWSAKGGCYVRLGQCQEAIEVFDKVLSINPNDAVTWGTKGSCHAYLGQYQEAVAAFDKALSIDPNNTIFRDAKEELKKISSEKISHKNIKELQTLAFQLYDQQKYQDSLGFLERALVIDPDNTDSWNLKGVILNKLNRSQEALAAFDRALSINPNYEPTWYFKGVFYHEQGQYKNALDAFNKALAINPNDAKTWSLKGNIHGSLGQYQEALDAFNKALSIDPNNKIIQEDQKVALKKLTLANKNVIEDQKPLIEPKEKIIPAIKYTIRGTPPISESTTEVSHIPEVLQNNKTVKKGSLIENESQIQREKIAGSTSETKRTGYRIIGLAVIIVAVLGILLYAGVPLISPQIKSPSGQMIITVPPTPQDSSKPGGTQVSGPLQMSAALVKEQTTSLQLPQGAQLYLYGYGTGGGASSGEFVHGQVSPVTNNAGYTVASLAASSTNSNSFTTNTGYQVIGGAAIAGFSKYTASYGSNSATGASSASDTFTVTEPGSLVVIIAVAGGGQTLTITGIPNVQIDAASPNDHSSLALTVAHTTLDPDVYTVTEQTAQSAGGQDPTHAGNIIGVWVFQPSSLATAPLSTTAPSRTTISSSQIQTAFDSTLHIVSGTKSFTALSATNRNIRVSPGQTISGTVTVTTNNNFPSSAVVPLIYTPSWGTHSTSWRLVNNWITTGTSTINADVSLIAPQQPGTYYVLFAFRGELKGDQVASSTNWPVGHDVWDDGNDIASLDTDQIMQAQQSGMTVVNWLNSDGEHSTDVPADAITIIVN